jgi:hypothetical protein
MSDYHYIQASAVETEYMTYIWNAFSREHVQYSTEVNDMHAWSCTLQSVPWKWSCTAACMHIELIQKTCPGYGIPNRSSAPCPLWLAGETIFSDRSRFTDRRRSTTHVHERHPPPRLRSIVPMHVCLHGWRWRGIEGDHQSDTYVRATSRCCSQRFARSLLGYYCEWHNNNATVRTYVFIVIRFV